MKFFIYISRQLLLAFVVSAAGMVFIAMPGVAVGAVHKLGGAGMGSVMKLVPMMVAVFVPYVLPVALLLALVSTYGRLSAQNEWTAIRMSGVNPYRMLLPAVALATMAGAGVYVLNAEVLPRIKEASKTIILDEFKQELKNLSRGRTDLSIEGFFLTATYRDPEDHQTFYDCLIKFPIKGAEEPVSLFAETVRFSFTEDDMIVRLINSSGAQPGVEINHAADTSFTVSLDALTGAGKKRDFSNPRYLTAAELQTSLGRLEDERLLSYASLSGLGITLNKHFYARWVDPERRLIYTWHQHWANAATCLMFVLVGVSTGLLLRKGTQLSALAVSIGVAMAYWIASLRIGKQLAREGLLDPWVGAWGPLAAFTLLGLFLIRKALRE